MPSTLAPFGLVVWSLGFFGRHALVVLGLALIAAIGRVLQIGRAKRLPKPGYIALEIGVEVVRLAMVLAIFGDGDPLAAAKGARAWLSAPGRSSLLARLAGGLGLHWPQVLIAALVFVLVAVVANMIIFALARSTRVLALAGGLGVEAPDQKSLRLAVMLFIKNLTIIPFTVIWVWGLLAFLIR